MQWWIRERRKSLHYLKYIYISEFENNIRIIIIIDLLCIWTDLKKKKFYKFLIWNIWQLFFPFCGRFFFFYVFLSDRQKNGKHNIFTFFIILLQIVFEILKLNQIFIHCNSRGDMANCILVEKHFLLEEWGAVVHTCLPLHLAFIVYHLELFLNINLYILTFAKLFLMLNIWNL